MKYIVLCFILILLMCAMAKTQVTHTLHVDEGWNLLSLPVSASDSMRSTLFQTATSAAYVYEHSYSETEMLRTSQGFWLKFDSEQTISISGTLILGDSIPLQPGWNLIGGLSTPIPVDSILTDPPGLISSSFFGYSSGYYQTDTLWPGNGYWVRVSGAAMMTNPYIRGRCPNATEVTYGGETYGTILIGNQCWLQKNLNVGTMIDGSVNQGGQSMGVKYCYDNDLANCEIYGGLYQESYAQPRCPGGWHLPSRYEFYKLYEAVGNNANALKEKGQGTGAGAGTNISGFSALLGGGRIFGGRFSNKGVSTNIWTSTGYNDATTYVLYLTDNDGQIHPNLTSFDHDGGSVRCLQNELPTVTTSPIRDITSSSAIGGGEVTANGGVLVTSRGVCWSTSQNPTIADSKSTDGGGTGVFTSFLSGLTNHTTYYVRAYATNSVGTAYGNQMSFEASGQNCPGLPTVNYVGGPYHTVQIGTQCWLRENLNIGYRIDGSADQTNNNNNNTIEKYCYDNNEANCTTYGGLYQWGEAMQYSTLDSTTTRVQGICPSGWHIPTEAEFQTLKATVGDDGNALKAAGQGTGAGAGTNTSGFSALLAGYRHVVGGFYSFGGYAGFWSSSENDAAGANYLSLNSSDSNVYVDHNYKDYGFSVRCLKD